jgi:glycolate oxidase iron-sulfur subunit
MRFLLMLATVASIVLVRLRVLHRLPIIGPLTKGLRPLSLPITRVAGGSWGTSGGPVALFLSGCIADVWFTDVHRSAIDVLVRAGYRVEAPSNQTCCGALAAHSGYADEAESMANVNIDAFRDADVIVTDVAGCGAHMASYGGYGEAGADIANRVRDINDLVAELISQGTLPVLGPTGVTVAIQDPCHLEHGQKVHKSVDVVVEAAGYVAVPADRGGLCCGAAGIYQIEHPEMSGDLGRAKADTIEGSGAAIVVSANAGCEMQLRRYLGSDIEVMHPIELYAKALGAE